ncbi:MAG: hypothetical protein QM813_25160 [Verrucomicrobiota bacterium]
MKKHQAEWPTTAVRPERFREAYITAGTFPVLGQPGITTNSITLSSGQPGLVTAGYYPEFNQSTPFSFEIWARPTSIPTGGDYRCPIGNFSGWGAAVPSGWYVYQTPDVPSALALVTPTGVWISYPNYSVLNWYHLVGTYDGNNIRFYVNGVLIGTQSAATYVANTSPTAVALGQRGDGYGTFDGGLDEFAYYTNALSGAQVLAHYQSGTNSFRLAALPPSILTAPVSTNAYAGHTVYFNVIADGTQPLTYQWYKGTTPISGATGNVLAFTCTPTDDGSTYQVVIANSVNSVTSSPVSLTVSTDLLIVAPLTSITRNVGSAAVFEVVANGALPISYQWHNGDASVIPGATNNVLWLSNVQPAQDGSSYYVSVINPYITNESSPATLTVQARPVTKTPTGYAKVVVADGPVAYWQLDEPEGSTVAVDTVGSFDGTYVTGAGTFTFGATTGIPHYTNTALGISGGATVSVPFAIEINPPVGGFTWEGWFNPASLAANGNDYRTVFCSMSNPYGAGNTGWLVYQTADNHWAWWPRNGFYAGVSLTDPDLVVANQWYYLTLVYDGSLFTLYVNGVAKTSGTDPGFVQNGNVPLTPNGPATYNYNYNTTPGLPVGSGATVFGWRSPVDFQPFSGLMDDIAVYNKALTPAQIQNHYQNSTRLSIVKSGSNVVVAWPTGTLQAAGAATGVYTNVPGAVSPYTNTISGAQLYYRVQLQ